MNTNPVGGKTQVGWGAIEEDTLLEQTGTKVEGGEME